MADIFLSYAQADAKRAKQVAEALEAKGWSVWWDVSLVAGDRFRSKIAEQLRAAKCVVVLWSQQSIESDWVIDEAEDGKNRRILVQALIEDVRPPHGFRQIQAATLIEWKGGESGEFSQFCKGISAYAHSGSPQKGVKHSNHAADPPAVAGPPPLNWTPGLAQWVALKRDFENLGDPDLFGQVRSAPGPMTWTLGALGTPRNSLSDFQKLAQRAGELLSNSPRIWANVRDTDVGLSKDHINRWLCFLFWSGSCDSQGYIRDLARASALACADCGISELPPDPEKSKVGC